MRISRLYYAGFLRNDSSISLPLETSHYILHVLRLKIGSRLLLFNGDGREYTAVIKNINKKAVTVNILDSYSQNLESPLKLHLAQAISKSDKMDIALQKAVELGVSSITPLLTDYNPLRLEGERADKKMHHWQKIIISACEQSGRTCVPLLNSILTFNTAVEQLSAKTKLFCHPGSPNTLTSLPRSQEVLLLIGPEGGLSPTEVLLAEQHHFIGISLGPRILRTETAVLTAISILQAQWGDL